jgi:hypothetical protein
MNVNTETSLPVCFDRPRLIAFWIGFLLGALLMLSGHLIAAMGCVFSSSLLRPSSAVRWSAHPVARCVLFVIAAACFALALYGREPFLTPGYRAVVILVSAYLLYFFVRDVRSFRQLPPLHRR